MDLFKFLLLLAASFRTVYGATDPDVESLEAEAGNPSSSANLAVRINTTFPSSEIFGVKLVNGVRNSAVLSVHNSEPNPVTLQFVSGSLWTPDRADPDNPPQIVKNLTAIRYGGVVPAGESETFSYGIQMEMHPQDLLLKLGAVLNEGNRFFSVGAFEGTVSVVEKPQSVFDPQVIFLYLILAGGFAGTAYFVYNTWISTLFPQQKRGRGKGGERARVSLSGKPVDPAAQVGVVGADGPAVTSGAKKGYDESWIPQHHIQRPEAKRIRSGTPSGTKTKKAA